MNENQVKEQTKKIIGRGQRILRRSVNIFIYTFLGIFMFLIVFFGISQTSFFKNWLRDTVVEIVNDGINGKISIGEIDGTIFTSLIIKDVALTTVKKDTVVSANKIELRTSPLKILFKNIYVRKFELADAKIKLVEEEDGELNLLKIFPPSEEPEDTTSSEFPFTIEVADFKLSNVDFSLQKFDKLESTEYYKSINMNDLRINDLDISFSAFADLNKYAYRLTLDNISFAPNFQIFQLKKLSGTVLLTPQLAGINKLRMVTNESEVELSAAISGIDFFGNFSSDSLAVAPIRLSMKSEKLNFDDLTTYIPALNMLSGSIAAEFEASGNFNDLNIKKLNVEYGNTSLKAKARLQNLLDIEKMFFEVNLNDSYLDPSDPNKLLKEIDLPEYKELGIVKFDTLNYSGTPSNFSTKFALTTDQGILNGDVKFDLRGTEIIYEAAINTKNLNLNSFMSIPTDMNSDIRISGLGFNPEKMKMDLDFKANSSTFGNKFLRNINLVTTAQDGLIGADLDFSSDSTFALIKADLNFKNPDDPTYEINGQLQHINLASLLDNPTLDSKLNLTLEASGQGFNPDSMDLFLVTDIKESKIFEFEIDSSRLIMDIRRNDNGKKIINLVSDLADFTLSGNYSILSLGEVFKLESEIINSTISQKISPIFYPDSSINFTTKITGIDDKPYYDEFNMEYILDFKESMKIQFGENFIEMDGQIQGECRLDDYLLSASLDADVEYLKYFVNEDVYFLLNTGLSFDLSNSLYDSLSNELRFDAQFDSERMYAGGYIYNLSSKINFAEDQLNILFDGQYEEDIRTSILSTIKFDDKKLNLDFERFSLSYRDFLISNENDIKLSYENEVINFDDFNLNAGDGFVKISGAFGNNGDNQAELVIDSLSGNKIVKDIFGKLGDKDFNSDINLTATLYGNFSNPKFIINGFAENIKYGESNFGSLYSSFKFADNSLDTDIRILDSLKNNQLPALSVKGYIPLKLTTVNDSKTKNQESIDLTVESDEFNLASLKDILPYMQFERGMLETEMFISGTISSPIAIGYFSINDARFKLKNNNLDYDFNTKVWIDDEDITIESIELKNIFGTKNGGAITGNGFVKLEEFRLDSTFIRLAGDLKVLDITSKSASPFVYGNVALATRSDIIYSGSREQSYINLPLDVTVAEIVVPLSNAAYRSTSGFIYKYAEYNGEKDILIVELDSLIQSKIKKDSISARNKKLSKFNYTVDIKLKTEAEVEVILSKELDQNLSAILDGDFLLESIDGITRSGGELTLLEGSKLSFIKTFEAEGNVKFDKINNPIVNITSTYKNYYIDPKQSNSSEQEVAVKIKVKGPLSELDKNFVNDEDNIGVYIGRQNIEDDKKDPAKNATDAMFFILTGTFPGEGENSEQNSNIVGEYATSVAGSLIGGLLNQYFDDYVKSFQLRQTSTDTKFSLIGKAWKIKYEIGGSTEVLQDLSRANIKMELPITKRLQLRLERKESENQNTSINNPLFFEGAVKYNFEF